MQNSLHSKKNFLSILLLTAISISNISAYEVWIGLHCTPKNAGSNPAQWSITASKVEGLNCNLAAGKPAIGTPNENDIPCVSLTDWGNIVNKYSVSARRVSLIEIPRSSWYHELRTTMPVLDKYLSNRFSEADKVGYNITRIMFYENRLGSTGPIYKWTNAEIQSLRDWLNSNGHSDVRLIWNTRGNSNAEHTMCENPLVDDIMIESSAEYVAANTGNIQSLPPWIWSNPLLSTKKLIFQIPLQNDPYGNPNGYQNLRRLIVWYGQKMAAAFMQSPRVVFMPVTYNGGTDIALSKKATFAFYPEIESSTKYSNTLTGVVLSLIEQREMFELRSELPTNEDADSFERKSSTHVFNPKSTSEIEKAIKIYPNPVSTDKVFFDLSSINIPCNSIEMISISGCILKSVATQEKKIEFSMKDFEAGTYFLRFGFENQIATKMLFVN